MIIKDVFRKLFFYRQHPDAALRYLPIVDLLKRENLMDAKILEIGSGSYGITPYLKREVTGVDITFDEPRYQPLKQIQASATSLPFKDKEFDVVIMSDFLEHLPEEQREKAIDEATRVASQRLIISGPFGDEAFFQDKKLLEQSIKATGKAHPYFVDHIKNGLPNRDQLVSYLKKKKEISSVKVVGVSLNLGVRKWLMSFFLAGNKISFYFYLKGLMLIVPFLRIMNQQPCYRTLIKADL